MLKIYIINGKEWQYEEGTQPKGAIEKTEPQAKAVQPPANKVRKAKNK